MLGLARRAGAVSTGTDATKRAIREGRALFVVLAGDASEVQKGKLIPLMERRGVPHRVWGTREELGGAVGAGLSSAVAITQASFAKQVKSRLQDDTGPSVQ